MTVGKRAVIKTRLARVASLSLTETPLEDWSRGEVRLSAAGHTQLGLEIHVYRPGAECEYFNRRPKTAGIHVRGKMV
ncbi:hypothetical protein BaRGS_00038254 [Batillaria attramentaria]|uniref:Uncharacterized protein n=1 Tax=Batillaria attramentaria TaxID=370345 RepID=A0ABD0J7U2_9CAEN